MLTLHLSDIHIGGLHFNHHEALIALLHSRPWDIVVWNGDVFDQYKHGLDGLNSEDKRLCEAMRTRPDGHITKHVFIHGNHEPFLQKVGPAFTKDSYSFMSGGKRVTCIHGHEFSTFSRPDAGPLLHAIEWGIVVFQKYFDRIFGTNVQKFLRNLNFRGKYKRVTDGSVREWLPHMTKMRDKVIAHYQANNADQPEKARTDIIIAGHNHLPEHVTVPGFFESVWCEKKKRTQQVAYPTLQYLNTGTWVDDPSYVVIEDGEVRLCFLEHKLV